MATIGYHASHEQFAPSDLLRYAQMAEQAGFGAISCSDHFYPWSERQGQSGFAWSWLGAAMALTSLPFGVVNAPGQRYHPAIIAQAAATLAEMFPDRFWVAFGSGQAMNEHITGDHYPNKRERDARLKECVDIIRALWNGETVTHHGRVVVENAKLYTRPQHPPLAVGAAITPKTAGWMGNWADALITISKPLEELKKTVDAFRNGGGEGKPMFLKVQLSYDRTEEKARRGAHDQWRNNIFASDLLAVLTTPAEFDAAGQFVTPDQLDDYILISDQPEFFVERLQEYRDLGFSLLTLHNVNREHEQFIRVFGEEVLPALQSKTGAKL